MGKTIKELNSEIIEINEKIIEKQKLIDMITSVKESLKLEQDRKITLQNQLMKEELDVNKLESISIAGIFYTIVGRLEKQIEKEQQEVLSVRLRYDICCKCIEALEQELIQYEQDFKNYKHLNSRYKSLLIEKQKFMIGCKNEGGKELLKRIDEIAKMQANIKEIKEAINAANKVKSILVTINKSLDSADNWGTLDMLGGGIITTAIKHEKIDDANKNISKLQAPLRKLQKELSDINIDTDLNIDNIKISSFADYFLDGLFADGAIQSKIYDSSISIMDIYDKIERLINDLEKRLIAVKNQLENNKKNVEDFIEQYE